MRKYNTKQRCAIESVFRLHPDKCFSAKEVTDVCGNIGVATVYRTLSVLESDGVIRRFMSSDGDLFKLASKSGHHMHIVCRACGDMLHSECAFIGEMERHLKAEHGFSLDTAATVIYGLCGRCSEESGR